MGGVLTDLEATMGTYQLRSYGETGVRELLIGAPKAQHLATFRPPWGPISIAPMAANSREATVTARRRGETDSPTYK